MAWHGTLCCPDELSWLDWKLGRGYLASDWLAYGGTHYARAERKRGDEVEGGVGEEEKKKKICHA
jgi:hypothetical protein